MVRPFERCSGRSRGALVRMLVPSGLGDVFARRYPGLLGNSNGCNELLQWARSRGHGIVAEGTILINFAGVMAIARTIEATQNVLSGTGVSFAGDLADLSEEDVEAFLGDFCQCFLDQLTLIHHEREGLRARGLTYRRHVISALKDSLFWPNLERTIETVGTNDVAYGIVNHYDVVAERTGAQAISWTFIPSTIVERWYWMGLEISQGHSRLTLQGPELPFAMPN